ncbi:MAG TPA: Ig-like domain-containing protein [Gemmatimonadales bacterium]
MRLLTRRIPASLTLLSLACARMEPPPGGPPDAAAPQLVATVPDSFQVLPDFDDDVEFRFDEVISEGGAPSQGSGTGDLERLVILSPSTAVPRVRWRRNRITVRPDEGWQPDRVYRVELLPGVTDLRRNRLARGAMVTFSTGAPAPRTTFEGLVVDWSSARPAQGALVVALRLPDSLPYRGLADSTGRFSLGPLPAGEYVVSGVLDENRNHFADPREAFDSVRVTRSDSTLELWAFVHDTTPPRIRTVTSSDSTAATVELTQPLDPRQRLQPSAVRLSLLPDSTPVRVSSILPKPLDDSLRARRSPADTTARDTTAARDSAPAARPRPGARPGPRRQQVEQLTSRPALSNQLVLRPAAPWPPGARYTVEIRGVRNVTGVSGDVVGTLVIPERVARDTLAPADTLRQPGDTVPVKPAPRKPAPTKPAPTRPAPTQPAPARPR